ncbi:Bax inhibitor-1/YccA family protein [Pantoea sp. Aalb]|uniref:Bax inhibitor-1/YccA family protein n=1 Tax=Pantoea sp. Aalb TaxID=2576762 RepID=UPI0013222753|nr:Bax inhibitor-1/YccA family protein [Pantoea sp. Aalb]MXP67518.1 Bax inhibitor-1/YccA family protein [Pantoea sp. Aalb]
MERYFRNNSIEQQVSAHLQTYMAQVYGWMTCGLLLTSFVSWLSWHSPALMTMIFANRSICFGLIILQLAVVFLLSSMVDRLSGAVATSLFMFYSTLTGLTISSIFLVYTVVSISSTFFVTATMFGSVSLYGYITKNDLSRFSSLLFMALIGVLIASLVNFWLKSSLLTWILNYVGVIVFVCLTAYDTQKLKIMGQNINLNDKESMRRFSIMGALTLYLDFINLFLMLLKFFGNRR